MLKDGSAVGIFSGHGRIKKTTYKEQAYRLIKEAIIYQKLKPGTIYSQEAICQELGISRTPVREALLELQNEEYIHIRRGRGIEVISLDEKAIHSILEMRIYLEIASAELAAKRASKEDLDYIAECLENSQQNLDSQDIILCYRLDHQFHRAVAKAAYNEILYNAIDDVLNHYLRFEVLTVYQSKNDANLIWKEHNELYYAIKEHDSQKAHYAAKKHLQDAYKRTLGNYWFE